MSATSTDKSLASELVGKLRQNQDVANDALRKEALETFSALGLPANKHEEFKYTPLTRELEKIFRQEPHYFAKPLPAALQIPSLPGVDAAVITFVNGKYSEALSTPLPTNIEVTSLRDLDKDHPLMSAHFGKVADFRNQALTAWNTAAWTDGVLVNVPANTVVEKPLFLRYINAGENGEANEFGDVIRNLVVCGKSSEVTVIEKFESFTPNDHFLNLVNEVVVGENAGFTLYSIHNDAGQRHQYTHTEIHQQKSSRVNTYAFTLNGKLIRNNLNLVIDGEGVESHMYGLYLLDGNTHADNHTVADHRKPNSFSNELYKGVMDGSSRGVFNGKIFVRPNAQKTNAFQANRNILLGDKSSVNTKPQLEIWADDVKCSHGCTSGQLDEEAMFYLRTRGISKDTARAMMLYAFVGEVIEKVSHEGLRQYLDNLVSDRLHKNF